jgi:subtilisin family serine protease
VYEVSCQCDAELLSQDIESRSKELTEPVIAPQHTLLNTPNDYTLAFSTDYALDLINAQEAWNFSTGDPTTIIGISDANYYLLHEELEGKVASTSPYNFSTNYYHGTAVAISAAGDTDNGTGKSAIGYDCKMRLSQINYSELLVMSQQGIRVINMSWSCGCIWNAYLQSLFNEIYENGTVLVAAAGNGSTCGGPNNPVYPAAYDHVISVTSVGENDNHERVPGDPNSSHQHNISVDICAPGYDVPISISSGTYMYASGTSFAAPLVTGTIGLMLSLKPCLTADEIEDILRLSSDDIYALNPDYEGLLGWGRLNAGKALELTELYGCGNWGSYGNSGGSTPPSDPDPLTVDNNAGNLSVSDPKPTHTFSSYKEDKLKYTSHHTLNLDAASLVNVRVFPNPTNGSSTVRTDFTDETTLSIFDAQGRLIHTQSISAGLTETSIQLVESGVYFLSISSNGERVWLERVVRL